MPVGVPLSELRRLLRAEVGQSLNPAQGVNSQQQFDLMLARQQQELWEAYDWPHLHYYSDMILNTGQRNYDYPDDMPFDNINKAWLQDGTNWVPVAYGIEVPHYAANGGENARSWPITRWANHVNIVGGKVVPAGQAEVLPVPGKNGVLRFEGQANTNPLVADTDICVLDSTLIVLYAASEILAERKSEAASLKLQKAQQYLRRLLANQGGDKRRIHVLGGASMVAAMQGPDGYSSQRFRTPTG